jgi:hypothetical protein
MSLRIPNGHEEELNTVVFSIDDKASAYGGIVGVAAELSRPELGSFN